MIPAKQLVEAVRYKYALYALEVCKGDKRQAARAIDVSLATFYRFLDTKPEIELATALPKIQRLSVLEPCKPPETFAIVPTAPPTEPVPAPVVMKAPLKALPNGCRDPRTLFRFFGVQVLRDSNFWIANKAQLDWLAYDAHANYLKMVRSYHPDQNPEDGARMAEVNRIWGILRETLREHGVEV